MISLFGVPARGWTVLICRALMATKCPAFKSAARAYPARSCYWLYRPDLITEKRRVGKSSGEFEFYIKYLNYENRFKPQVIVKGAFLGRSEASGHRKVWSLPATVIRCFACLKGERGKPATQLLWHPTKRTTRAPAPKRRFTVDRPRTHDRHAATHQPARALPLDDQTRSRPRREQSRPARPSSLRK
jgi:hypothetical protein